MFTSCYLASRLLINILSHHLVAMHDLFHMGGHQGLVVPGRLWPLVWAQCPCWQCGFKDLKSTEFQSWGLRRASTTSRSRVARNQIPRAMATFQKRNSLWWHLVNQNQRLQHFQTWQVLAVEYVKSITAYLNLPQLTSITLRPSMY